MKMNTAYILLQSVQKKWILHYKIKGRYLRKKDIMRIKKNI